MFNSGFRSLSKFEFNCSGTQQRQRGAIVLEVKALKPTGIQYVTISRYNKRRTSELRSTVSTVWNVASVSGSELQPTKRLSGVLPNQQSHQKYRYALV